MEACLSLCNKRLVREAREREFEDDMGEREREQARASSHERRWRASLCSEKLSSIAREQER